MKDTKRVKMWVSPEFKKFIKIKSVENGMSMTEFQDHILESGDPLRKLEADVKKKKKFEFGF